MPRFGTYLDAAGGLSNKHACDSVVAGDGGGCDGCDGVVVDGDSCDGGCFVVIAAAVVVAVDYDGGNGDSRSQP